MKKTFVFILALTLAFSLVSCKEVNDETTSPIDETTSPITEGQETEPTETEAQDEEVEVMLDIEKIKATTDEKNNQRVSSGYMMGCVYGIYDKDGELVSSAIGYSDLAGTKEMKTDAIFRMASMTKPVTGVAVMQLYEKGLIDLDAPISKWFPAFENMLIAEKIENKQVVKVRKATVQLTPRMLLSHCNGLGTSNVTSVHNLRVTDLAQSVNNYSTDVLGFEPTTNAGYSGTYAFDVLARIVEIESGMPFDMYVKRYIFDPLGMVDTTYLPNDEQLSRIVDFISTDGSSLSMGKISAKSGFAGYEDGTIGGGWGLFSTLDDYSRFARMLLRGGELDGVRILKEETVALMSTVNELSVKGNMNPVQNWGLSVKVREKTTSSQTLSVGSYGWSGAYGTHFWVDPELGYVAIYMLNLSGAGGSGAPTASEFEACVASGVIKE